MTVPTTTSRADYTGNGSTTAWTVPFYFLDPTHIQVIRTQISTGVATTLALVSDFTVSGAGVQAGGTLTTVAALTIDQRVSVLRNVPFTQLSHYVPNDPFPSATHEQIVDQLTMEVQQLYESQTRTFTVPANETSITLPAAATRALKVLGFDALGAPLAVSTVAAGYVVAAVGPQAGLRNRFINGDMRVAQRGASGTASANLSYALDRWLIGYGGTAPTWAQTIAAIPGGNQSATFLQLTGTAATLVFLRQRIESANCRDMAGQTVTLSWYAYQSTGSAMLVTSSMSYATATDNFTAVTPILTSSATSVPNAAFTLITAQFTIPTAAVTGLEINLYANTPSLSGGAAINATQVQLEVGPIATPFEQRPYGMELALCQRYFYSIGGNIANEDVSVGVFTSATTVNSVVRFPIRMRGIPAITPVGAATNWQALGVATFGATAIAAATISVDSLNFGLAVSGATAGQAAYIRSLATSTYITVSAEL